MELINQIFNLAKGVVIKEENIAESYETPEITSNFDIYKATFLNYTTINPKTFTPDSYDTPISIGFNVTSGLYLLNEGEIGKDYDINFTDNTITFLSAGSLTVDGVTSYRFKTKDEILEGYVEKNNYYRYLNGKPPYGEEGIKLTEAVAGVDITKYVHEMTDNEIGILYNEGVLDSLIEDNHDKRYLKCLLYRVPYVISRTADKFSLLNIYVQSSEIQPYVKDTFKTMYEKNRVYFIRTIYNEYYHKNYDYYEELMIRYLVLSTIISTIDELNEELIDISMLDSEDIDNLLEEYGVPNRIIPNSVIKKKLVKVINKLIINKGSKQTIIDVADLFGINTVYRYYLHKRLILEGFSEEDDIDDVYQLEFVKVPFGEKNIYKYLKNSTNRIEFSNFVTDDERWGTGSDDLEDILLEKEFSFMSTKYMSIENMIELTRLAFDNALFFQCFLNKDGISQNLFLIYSNEAIETNVFELLVYVISLSILLLGYEDDIPFSSEEVSYIVGLNDEADFSEFIHQFKVYFSSSDDEDLLDMYESFDSGMNIFEVMDTYANDKNIIDKIRNLMSKVDNFKNYDILNNVYKTMTTVNAIRTTYGVEKYSEYLSENNVSLFERYYSLKSDGIDSDIRDEIISVLNFLEEKLNFNNSLDMLNDNVNEILDILKKYLYYVIEFFKSHTNDLKDLSVRYVIDDPFNRLAVLESLTIHESLSLYDRMEYFLDGNIDEILSYKDKGIKYIDEISISDNLITKDFKSKGGFIIE